MKPELDVCNVALCAQYLMLGAVSEEIDPDEWNGQIGLAERLCEFAIVVEKFLMTTNVEEYSGVIYYELIEDMGAWAAENHPTTKEFDQELRTRYDKWKLQ